MTRPIVFLTDYGLTDEFVGICHGVIARIAPDARVIDLSHTIPRQDVMRGALTLARATPYMPEDAVYVAVVDPGVGSDRRSIVVRTRSGADLVGPDNGLLSLAWQALGGAVVAADIASPLVTLETSAKTFHGRDVFAPASAWIATGFPIEELGPPVDLASVHVLDLPRPMVTPGAIGARVSGIDGFGNVQLNATPDDLQTAGLDGDVIRVLGRRVPLVGVFADLPEHGLGMIVDAQGHLALVVNRGSAADRLAVSEGSAVVLE
jgi:S-adenosyl-L-methionine hydrolase (adenosine-forming)